MAVTVTGCSLALVEPPAPPTAQEAEPVRFLIPEKTGQHRVAAAVYQPLAIRAKVLIHELKLHGLTKLESIIDKPELSMTKVQINKAIQDLAEESVSQAEAVDHHEAEVAAARLAYDNASPGEREAKAVALIDATAILQEARGASKEKADAMGVLVASLTD